MQVAEGVEYFTESILGVWEEGAKSIVRETFNTGTRLANSFFSGCLKFLGGETRQEQGSKRTQAWQSWWQEDRQSTLNAFIAKHSPSRKNRPQGFKAAAAKPSERESRSRWDSWRGKTRFNLIRWKNAVWGMPAENTRQRRSSCGNNNNYRRQFLRTGSDLFDRPSGYAVESSSKGILEDLRMSLEMGVTYFIEAIRKSLRFLFVLPRQKKSTRLTRSALARHNTAPLPADDQSLEEAIKRSRSLRKSRSKSVEVTAARGQQTTAGDAIRAAGYPLQVHTVTTPDGYVMQMERIPRPGVREVVFFMHGILDTSMGWVANGTGSHAFAAYDQGMDVWLGSSRSNPPRKNTNPDMQGAKYWNYSINEMGTSDCLAQIDHVHVVKCRELHTSAGPSPLGGERREASVVDTSPVTAKGLRKSRSESELDALAQTLGMDHSVEPLTPLAGEAVSTELNGKLDPENPENPEASNKTEFAPQPFGSPQDRVSKGRFARRSTSTIESRSARAALHKDNLGRAREQPLSPIGEVPNGLHRQEKPNLTLDTDNLLNMIDSSDDSLIGSDVPEAEESLPDALEELQDGDDSSDGGFVSPAGEAALGSSPTPSLPARLLDTFRSERGMLEENESTRMTPDRSSNDGVEDPETWGHRPRNNNDRIYNQQLQGHASRGKVVAKDPYRLRVVGHSLGGAALLIYLVTSRLKQRNHHIYRLILLTPAGFLQRAPRGAYIFIWGLPVLMRLNNWLRPGKGAAVLIPSTWLRYITFKFTADLQSIPALQELTQAGIRLLLNGDASQWDRAMRMPHYNPTSMPALSLNTGIHLVQWVKSAKFRLFDYGSASANKARYEGRSQPPDIAANYSLIDCPVDIMAGKADGIIAAENVRMHYDTMQKAGCNVTYKEFDFGHLDFTFALKEDLVYYVQSRLRLRS